MLPTAKGIFFRGCLSGLTQTCFRVCYSYKRFALGKTSYIRNKKKKKKIELAASGRFSYTDVHLPRALVTDRTRLVRGLDGTVPGPDTSLPF